MSLLAARAHKIRQLKKQHPFVEEGVLLSKMMAYCSKEAHSCVEKAAMMAFVKMRILEPDENQSLRGSTLQQVSAARRDAPRPSVHTSGYSFTRAYIRTSAYASIHSSSLLSIHSSIYPSVQPSNTCYTHSKKKEKEKNFFIIHDPIS